MPPRGLEALDVFPAHLLAAGLLFQHTQVLLPLSLTVPVLVGLVERLTAKGQVALSVPLLTPKVPQIDKVQVALSVLHLLLKDLLIHKVRGVHSVLLLRLKVH